MQKIITILRHAKAETASAHQDDHERGLTARGMENAGAMGKYMVAQGIAPDRILSSTARRCRETAAVALGGRNIEYTDKLYLASANETLRLIEQTPETVHSLMLIGHNPGLHQLCLHLAVAGDHALLDGLAAAFPTCALATIIFNSPGWRAIGHARGRLAGFMVPKMLEY